VSTVTVSFTAFPEHVRTARFIVASVARRAGVSEGLLDEVRLAVSEACSMAVRQHRVFAPAVPVELTLIEGDATFAVRVSDAVGREGHGDATEDLLELAGLSEVGALGAESPNGQRHPTDLGRSIDLGGPDDEGVVGGLRARERIGLAVIEGLVDDVQVDYSGDGVVLTMTWPLALDDDVDLDGAGSAPLGGV
jgi:serine/threonine-protein kinase RsbW